MSLISRIKSALKQWVNARYLEEELAAYVAAGHHQAVMETLRAEFPELGNATVPGGLIGSIVRRANQRLLEHIL